VRTPSGGAPLDRVALAPVGARDRLLKERTSKGVRIRVIGSPKEVIEGVTVQRPEVFRLQVRAKIRDGTRASVGSESLRKVEPDKRREIGVLINNPLVTRLPMQVFESGWALPLDTEGKDLRKKAAPS
jgi:hypothetical protein